MVKIRSQNTPVRGCSELAESVNAYGLMISQSQLGSVISSSRNFTS
jgi:hypothetical protein